MGCVFCLHRSLPRSLSLSPSHSVALDVVAVLVRIILYIYTRVIIIIIVLCTVAAIPVVVVGHHGGSGIPRTHMYDIYRVCVCVCARVLCTRNPVWWQCVCVCVRVCRIQEAVVCGDGDDYKMPTDWSQERSPTVVCVRVSVRLLI